MNVTKKKHVFRTSQQKQARERGQRGGGKEVEVGPWGNNFLCGYGLMCVNNFFFIDPRPNLFFPSRLMNFLARSIGRNSLRASSSKKVDHAWRS